MTRTALAHIYRHDPYKRRRPQPAARVRLSPDQWHVLAGYTVSMILACVLAWVTR